MKQNDEGNKSTLHIRAANCRTMFKKQEILELIKQKINTDHNLGDKTGGSGHKGFVDYRIDDFETRELSSNCIEITFSYRIFVETEFTYYPDNPPMEYPYVKKIVVDREKQILPDKSTQ